MADVDARLGVLPISAASLTGYCKLCGVLLADVRAHFAWHDSVGGDSGE